LFAPSGARGWVSRARASLRAWWVTAATGLKATPRSGARAFGHSGVSRAWASLWAWWVTATTGLKATPRSGARALGCLGGPLNLIRGLDRVSKPFDRRPWARVTLRSVIAGSGPEVCRPTRLPLDVVDRHRCGSLPVVAGWPEDSRASLWALKESVDGWPLAIIIRRHIWGSTEARSRLRT